MNDLTDLILSNAMSNANSFKEGYEAGFKAAQKIVDKFVKEWLAEVDQKLAAARTPQGPGPEVQAERAGGGALTSLGALTPKDCDTGCFYHGSPHFACMRISV